MNGGTNGYNNARATIYLYSNDTNVGIIIFSDSGQPIEQDFVDENNLIMMHQPITQLPIILDVLQKYKIEINYDQITTWLNTA